MRLFGGHDDVTTRKETNSKSSGANLGFERKLWEAADKLRSNMDAAEYKHIVLGLLFLKYISCLLYTSDAADE